MSTLDLFNYNYNKKSNRINIKRNKIINSIKKFQLIFRNFLIKSKKHIYNHLDKDPITLIPIYTVPKKLLYTWNENNKIYALNSLELLKWIVSNDFTKYPVNPLSNIKLKATDRFKCYNIVKNFLNDDIFFKKIYKNLKINKEKYFMINKLLKDYISKEYYRFYPNEYLYEISRNIKIVENINLYYNIKIFDNYFDIKEYDYEFRANFDYYNILYNYGFNLDDCALFSTTERLLFDYYKDKKYITKLIMNGHFID